MMMGWFRCCAKSSILLIPLVVAAPLVGAVHKVDSMVMTLPQQLLPTVSSREEIISVNCTLNTPAIIDLSEIEFSTVGGDNNVDHDDGESQQQQQVLDFVIFRIYYGWPKGSSYWPDWGFGARDDEDRIHYCCSGDAISRKLCPEEDTGKFIINDNLFHGLRRSVSVPTSKEGDSIGFYHEDPVFHLDGPSYHRDDFIVIVFGNCNTNGADISASGSWEWTTLTYASSSKFHFYAVLASFHLLLVCCYCCCRMIRFRGIQPATRHPIQIFIVAAMLLGFLGYVFLLQTVDQYLVLGEAQEVASECICKSRYKCSSSPHKILPALTTSLLDLSLDYLKGGIIRCLGVMTATGWGVVQDRLGEKRLAIILFMGLLYFGLGATCQCGEIWFHDAAYNRQTVPYGKYYKFEDVCSLLFVLKVAIDVAFVIWIRRSFNATIQYLRRVDNTSKLRRLLQLNCIFNVFIRIVVAIFMYVILSPLLFGNLSGRDEERFNGQLDGAMDLNYLFALTGIALIWTPNTNDDEYERVSASPESGENNDNEIEFSSSVVAPSVDNKTDHTEHPETIQNMKGP